MNIRIWDVPYAYGPIYVYGAEHQHHQECSQISKNIGDSKQLHVTILNYYCRCEFCLICSSLLSCNCPQDKGYTEQLYLTPATVLPPHLSCHMNSCRYESRKAFCTPVPSFF